MHPHPERLLRRIARKRAHIRKSVAQAARLSFDSDAGVGFRVVPNAQINVERLETHGRESLARYLGRDCKIKVTRSHDMVVVLATKAGSSLRFK